MSTEAKKPEDNQSQGGTGLNDPKVRTGVNLNEDSKKHDHDSTGYERLIRSQQNFKN